jgi:large conductance mechanosensitive channel
MYGCLPGTYFDAGAAGVRVGMPVKLAGLMPYSTTIKRGLNMLKGFRNFVLRGNVIDLAVAVVMGAAFGAVVNSVVKNLITPLIALAGGTPDFSAIRTGPLLWGNILNDVLSFMMTAAVVYFVVVMPMNRLLAQLKASDPPPRTTRNCPECLSEIPLAARRCAHCTAQVAPVAP